MSAFAIASVLFVAHRSLHLGVLQLIIALPIKNRYKTLNKVSILVLISIFYLCAEPLAYLLVRTWITYQYVVSCAVITEICVKLILSISEKIKSNLSSLEIETRTISPRVLLVTRRCFWKTVL